jgi:hypothetical protein
MNETGKEQSGANVEYVRRLYADVLEWYKNADSKAQVVLTLDGLFLAFIAATLFEHADVVNGLRWHTALFLSLMVVSLATSVGYAVACIWSRIYSHKELEEFLCKEKVDISNHQTYTPAVSWFFQIIGALDEGEFKKRMGAVNPVFEVESLSSQIIKLSRNVRTKHRYVNYGFIFAGITLTLFAMSAASFVLVQKRMI